METVESSLSSFNFYIDMFLERWIAFHGIPLKYIKCHISLSVDIIFRRDRS